MAGIVTVTFKTTVSTEDEVRDLLDFAQRQIDSGYYFDEGRIGHINLVSFEVTETLTITRAELDEKIKTAVDAAISAYALGFNVTDDRPSGLDE